MIENPTNSGIVADDSSNHSALKQSQRLNFKKIKWTKKELEYLKKNYQIKDIKQISRKLNRSKQAIIIRAHILKIKRKSLYEINPPTIKIKRLYEQGFSELEIAKKMNSTRNKIWYILKYFNTKKRIGRETYNLKKYKIILKNKEKQILIGSLLGDGCISKTKEKRNFLRYCESHCIKQKDYLKWKGDILKRFKPTYTQKKAKFNFLNQRVIKSKNQIRLLTRSHPYFNELRILFYPKGKKIFPKKLINEINPLALACWYLDDGWFNYKDNVCAISSSFKNKEAIIKTFKKFDIYPTFYFPPNPNNYHINFNRKYTDKFLRIIEKYVPNCMEYKLGYFRKKNKSKRENAIKKRTEKRRRIYKETGRWI